MASLRFSRDRRGYENTYLLHNSPRRPGPEAQLLYWFRTPPHVKIGRAAFDEDAIRALEEQHPDVEFDWDRILAAKPPAAPEWRDPRESRPARRSDRRPTRDTRPEEPRARPVAAAPLAATHQAVPSPPIGAQPVSPVPAAAFPAVELDPDADLKAEAPEPAVEGPAPPARRFVRVFDAPADRIVHPTAHRASTLSVSERLLGPEQLMRLRARHAEILARISARGGDPAHVQSLRERAAAVDPDGWVTEAEVTAGLAALESTLAELHRIVGRRRRRRRGRRDAGQPTGNPTPGPENSSAGEGADGSAPDEVDEESAGASDEDESGEAGGDGK